MAKTQWRTWPTNSVFTASSTKAMTLPCLFIVRNPSSEMSKMSLLTRSFPVYTPPNVAKGGCNIFDEKTSRTSHVPKTGYFSKFGRLVKE